MSTFKNIRGQLIKSVASDPSPAAAGDMWYNSTSQTLKGVVLSGAWSSGGNLGSGRQSLNAAVTSTQTAGLVFGGNPAPLRTATEEYGGTSWTAGGAMSNARYQG